MGTPSSRRLSPGERGITESAQFALIWPLLLLVSLGIIQAGIWIHGHNVANRAAHAAADAASGSYGSSAEARQIAEGIARSGGLTDVVVQVSTTATVAEVEILLDLA